MSVIVAAMVLAWLCLILLALGFSGLLRQVRDLQSDLMELGAQGTKPLSGRRVAEFAGEPAVILVIDPGCAVCLPVLGMFAEVASSTPDVRFEALSYRASPDWPDLSPIRLRIDEQLYQQLDVPWAPALLRTDADGTITSVRPIESPADLSRQLSTMNGLAESPETTTLADVRS